MKLLQENRILLSSFAVFAFLLFFPKTSLAGTIYGITDPGRAGCSTQDVVEYCTQCNECFDVGSCAKRDCIDKEGNVVGECWFCWITASPEKWPEYKCEDSACEGKILTRNCEACTCTAGGKCEGTSDACNNERVCVDCDDWKICEECQDWQKPARINPCLVEDAEENEIEDYDCWRWSRYRKPECLCDGPCLDAPENPRYYNQPLYPLDECNPESKYQMQNNNVYLPVKLDWDDVKGWRDGWIENGECQQVLDCQSGNKACYEAPSDNKFEEKSDNLKKCKEDCRKDCYNKVLGITINGYWLSPYKILKFYREECFRDCTIDCRKKYTTDVKGCKEKCPHQDIEEKDRDYCYLQKKEPSVKNFVEVPKNGLPRLLFIEGYAQSYVIKIEGEKEREIRDPEAQQKIDVLKALIDHEISISKIVEYEREIEKIKEEELYINSWIEALKQSEFIPPSPCLLKSNRTYQWKVRACCPFIEEVMSNEEFEEKYGHITCPVAREKKILELKKEGTWVEKALDDDCGPWSNQWEFTTNPAPEPKLSYDPDWTDEGRRHNVSYEASRRLEWCEIEDEELYTRTAWGAEMYYKPLSYKVFVYYWDVNKSEFVCHPDFITEEGECVPMLLQPDVGKGEVLSADEFFDKHDAFFTKDTIYAWKVAACIDHVGKECTDFSQEWRLETFPWTLNIKLDRPWDDKETPIGLPVLLKWLSPGSNSYNYRISGIGEGKYHKENMTLDWPQLSLDTVYTWEIQPCLDYESEDCEEDWGGPWQFRTTGRPPKPETMKPTGNNIPIPVNFEWEKVPGAKSYIFKIWGNGLSKEAVATEEATFSLGYPDIKQETDYSWQITTCAHPKGKACNNGDPSPVQTFTTFKLKAPSDPKPEGGGIIYTYEPRYTISWKAVDWAKFYKYKVVFVSIDPKDPKEECKNLEGEIIAEGITDKTSVDLDLECWGEYQWQVTACLDENCHQTGYEGDYWSFSFVAEEAPPGTHGLGLVPCGRDTFDPTTPWRETDPCGIEHIFIMLYIIINFFLWKVIPIILVLLVLASGAIFYFSLQTGATDPLVQVKTLWKAAGIGLAVIFLAWIFISLFLSFFGYQVGLFGPWWRI